jgi:heme-degrading monooxygenase HmoA
MYVMLTQKLSKGFKSWKAMAEANAEKIKGFKGKVLYAGAHAEDDNSMVVIMHYESKDGLMAFKNDEELTKARQEAGALTETTVMTILGDDALTNFPN